MRRFAKNTSVSASKSVEEIKRAIRRFGCDEFGHIEKKDSATIMFKIADKMTVRMAIKMPNRSDFALSETGRQRAESVQCNAWDQEYRRRWRSLAAVVKAKLVAVDDGVATIEQEFMPYIVIGRKGETIGDLVLPQLSEITDGSKLLRLPAPSKIG
jgi:hypothetical protein